jgi:hypothetical protein
LHLDGTAAAARSRPNFRGFAGQGRLHPPVFPQFVCNPATI